MTQADTYGERLRWAAVEAVCRGWPVVPGGFGTDSQGVAEVCPLLDDGDATPVTDPDHAWSIWGRRPSGVLLACGRGIDALEVPFRVVELLPALAGADLAVPVATALEPSRWVLFVATGSGTLRDDLATASVRLHGKGEWVALPPTAVVGCPPLRWRLPPLDDGASAPAGADEVQRVLAEALRSGLPDADRG
ncbi:MAG: bifunctional DNA primase/polymerase [Pseudonocardiaceae bacterium]